MACVCAPSRARERKSGSFPASYFHVLRDCGALGVEEPSPDAPFAEQRRRPALSEGRVFLWRLEAVSKKSLIQERGFRPFLRRERPLPAPVREKKPGGLAGKTNVFLRNAPAIAGDPTRPKGDGAFEQRANVFGQTRFKTLLRQRRAPRVTRV